MKTTLTLTVSLLLAIAGYAQVPFTYENCPFQIGQEMHQTIYNGQIKIPSYSTTGATNTWDFSFLATDDSYEYVMGTTNTLASPCPDLTPDATAIVYEYDLTMPENMYYTICVLNPDSLTIVADYEINNPCGVLLDGLHYLDFPLNYGDNYIDNYQYSDESAFTFNYLYAAFGSLSLPLDLTFDQVALLQYQDEAFTQNIFYALTDGQYQMVLTLDSDGYFQFFDTDLVASIPAPTFASTQIKCQGQNRYALSNLNPCNWTIYNSLGQTVMQSTNKSELDLNPLSQGIYIVRAASNGSELQLKVCVSH